MAALGGPPAPGRPPAEEKPPRPAPGPGSTAHPAKGGRPAPRPAGRCRQSARPSSGGAAAPARTGRGGRRGRRPLRRCRGGCGRTARRRRHRRLQRPVTDARTEHRPDGVGVRHRLDSILVASDGRRHHAVARLVDEHPPLVGVVDGAQRRRPVHLAQVDEIVQSRKEATTVVGGVWLRGGYLDARSVQKGVVPQPLLEIHHAQLNGGPSSVERGRRGESKRLHPQTKRTDADRGCKGQSVDRNTTGWTRKG